jgi:hypothetical protein
MDVDAPFDAAMTDMHFDMNFDLGGDIPFAENDFGPALSDLHIHDNAQKTPRSKKRVRVILLIFIEERSVLNYQTAPRGLGQRHVNLKSMITRLSADSQSQENLAPSSLQGSVLTPQNPLSPASFSRLLLSQDDQPQPEIIQTKRAPKKPKRIVTLLDSRTELTDDELKVTLRVSLFHSHNYIDL